VGNDQLKFEIAKDMLATAKFAANERLFASWVRDGRPFSIILSPVWRLLEAERTLKPADAPAQAGGLFTAADARRVDEFVPKREPPPLPALKLSGPESTAPAPLRKFIGVWTSETGFNGAGRYAMLIIEAVDGEGRANGHYLWGPATRESP